MFKLEIYKGFEIIKSLYFMKSEIMEMQDVGLGWINKGYGVKIWEEITL